MTPKQKAKDLLDSYFVLLDGNVTFVQVKECALIAVDELLEATKRYDYTLSSNPIFNQYWLNVKSQIELL
jgi:hypothetical protein